MSCGLLEFCRLQEIKTVRDYLFRDQTKPVQEKNQTENELSWDTSDWESAWENDNNSKEQEATSVEEATELSAPWLQDCVVSLSPCSDLLVVAHEQKAVFLSAKWRTDSGGKDEMTLDVSWSGTLSTDEGECVSSAICIPLASQKRSSTGRPDWTCVVVGFTSGYVRFYTENGVLLLAQLLHEDPVLRLKCRTYEIPRHSGVTEQHEELSILYPAALVTIDGFSLFQSLRACRNQVARAAAAGSDVVQPPPLAYKKWGLQDMDTIIDHCSVGVMTLNVFDQMKNASILGGFKASVKGSPPAMSQCVTVGGGPYTGFYYAVEGSSQPLLSHVALAVASKLTSALFSAASGWLGWSRNKNEDEAVQKNRPKVEPATPLGIRFGLPDSRRHGESICLSPCNTLAGVTDDFGRVTLLDLTRGIAIRMWKGYRDAQLGWLHVPEERISCENSASASLPRRHALFLVIYAPRRGILEIWAMQHGPRVGAFTVGKHCRLLYAGYRLLGVNSVTSQGWQLHTQQVCLFDPITGALRTVTVPFHLALSDKKSEGAKDMHLLKRLTTILRSSDLETDILENEAKNVLLDIKHSSMKKEALESLLSSKNIPVLCLTNIMRSLLSDLQQEDPEQVDPLLQQLCSSQLKLLQLYTDIQHAHIAAVAECCQPVGSLDGIEGELTRVSPVLQRYAKLTSRPSVSFVQDAPDTPLSAQAFLSQIECTEDGQLRLIRRSETEWIQLGSFVFWACLCGKSLPQNICDKLQQASISPQQLLGLLLSVWLQREKEVLQNTEECVKNLHTLLILISNMGGAIEGSWDPQSVSPWWQQARNTLVQSHNSAAALLAAFVAHRAAKANITSRADSKLQSDWEAVSLELEHWLVCVRQLEDVVVLQTLLLLLPTVGSAGAAAAQCSVKMLMEGGTGGVTDNVSKWVFRHNLAPKQLKAILHKGEDNNDKTEEGAGESVKEGETSQNVADRISELLLAVCKRFPHSLSANLLFAHCCWEYVVQWNKDPEEGEHLCQAVEHLKLVSSPHIQLGICTMMWSTFIVKRFSAAAFLVEKVGKAPKDRLCRRDVGMGDKALTSFLGCCVQLLQILMEVDSAVAEVPAPELSVEEMWCGAEGPASIADLALEQKGVHYPLVQHHCLLASLLHSAMTFSLKVKPLSLFDSKGKNAFFRDLTTIQLMPSGVMDPSLVLLRQEFLLRVLTSWVQSIDDAPNSATGSRPPPLPVSGPKAAWWPSLCLELGNLLQVNPDVLRRHLVCQLYNQGLDLQAEEVMLEVEDKDVLGSQLLVITGQRLSYSLLHSQNQTQPAMELLARLPPTLCTWLKAMDPSELRCPLLPLPQTSRLVGCLIEMLPENHAQYSLALHLLEAVDALTTED
ncbi:rab3 GTPase-activating protein non-catalytic subunit [Nerophis lumbriciformis]|uniref:rab3 GTPase-activating protein non-catalytic subunit n=1 Tax=Nerophis lumbriciformis TaxID=546530 RepID=UPI002ADF0F8A|nr:rab3 GTPase-activating protein non-catalytic subunit-like [Nerophis lumbriciformis]